MREDLREEIKDEMLKRIKGAESSDMLRMEKFVSIFRDFIFALRVEAETKTITKP